MWILTKLSYPWDVLVRAVNQNGLGTFVLWSEFIRACFFEFLNSNALWTLLRNIFFYLFFYVIFLANKIMADKKLYLKAYDWRKVLRKM